MKELEKDAVGLRASQRMIPLHSKLEEYLLQTRFLSGPGPRKHFQPCWDVESPSTKKAWWYHSRR